MHTDIFEQSHHDSYFPLPAVEEITRSLFSEIQRKLPLMCVIGFPKSGKTTFVHALKRDLDMHAIVVPLSKTAPLAETPIPEQSEPLPLQAFLAKTLKPRERLVLLLDNAHLLQDHDFAAIDNFYAIARQRQCLLQIVLVGNGELVRNLARPDTKKLFNMLEKFWNIPKMTIEESIQYIQFFLTSSGMSRHVIADPKELAVRAAGSVGVLRTLTATYALKALGGQEAPLALAEPSTSAQPQKTTPPTSPAPKTQRGWGERLFVGGMAVIVIASIFFVHALHPDADIATFVRSKLPWLSSPPQELPPDPPQEVVLPSIASPSASTVVPKTVFRKRLEDGPYSIHLGTFTSVQGLLLNLPRFAHLETQIFWSTHAERPGVFELFSGRFATPDSAIDFAMNTAHMEEAVVVFRPFVIAVGPLHTQRDLINAGYRIGLSEPPPLFLRRLLSGAEFQVNLSRTRDEAMAHCAEMERLGLSCSITEYK